MAQKQTIPDVCYNITQILREDLTQEQTRNPQSITENKTTAKEIAKAFSAVMGQEISEEEASLIQNIQLLEDEVDCQNEDLETLEEESTTT